MGAEVASLGIRVNAVAPDFVDTDLLSTTPSPFIEAAAAQTPARRLGTADEVAFLASDRASSCNGRGVDRQRGVGGFVSASAGRRVASAGSWRYGVAVDFGAPELIILVVVVLVLFGGSQLPKLAKNLGKAQREFRAALDETKNSAAASADEESSA